jgi:ubiquinone/menaquinone biosynthesis C-methylase UbiE
MNDPEQALAYAQADFAEPHNRFVAEFARRFPAVALTGWVLDLGCGPGDITLRFANAYPGCHIHGVDAAAAMLAPGREAVQAAGLGHRVELIQGYLPECALPRSQYEAVISNSLLHHLRDPTVLWTSVSRYAAPEAPIFIMDLMRPETRAQAEALVAAYASDEPQVLQRDFLHSLLAAYRPDEVEAQLKAAGLSRLQVEVISDRHWIVCGRAGGRNR